MVQAPQTSFSSVSTTCIFLTTYPISKNLISIHNNYSICLKAKQTRLPFPLSTIKCHSPFNLLHCDIWGPHKIPTHFGKRFFLTIVDDYTRCTWLFLMNHKSETQHLLESLHLHKINFRHLLKPSALTTDWNLFQCMIFFSKKYWMSTHLRLHSSTKWSSRTQT